LGGGGEVEFIAGATRPAQPQPVEPQNAFEVREQHLDLFALIARGLVGLSLGDLASKIARAFTDTVEKVDDWSIFTELEQQLTDRNTEA
jgi:hypothetical protein